MAAVSVGAVLLLSLVGCGGGSKKGASDQAAKAACIKANTPSAPDPSMTGDAQELATRFCTIASNEGALQANGSVSNVTSLAILKAHPDIYVPFCSHAFAIGLQRTPPSFRANISVSPREFSSRLCRYMVEEGQIRPDGWLNPEAVGAVLTRHPQFGATLVYAGLMAAHNPSSGWTRRAWSKIAHRVALEELKSDNVYMTGFSPSDLQLREPASQRLIRRVTAEMRASGQIP